MVACGGQAVLVARRAARFEARDLRRLVRPPVADVQTRAPAALCRCSRVCRPSATGESPVCDIYVLLCNSHLFDSTCRQKQLARVRPSAVPTFDVIVGIGFTGTHVEVVVEQVFSLFLLQGKLTRLLCCSLRSAFVWRESGAHIRHCCIAVHSL